MNASSFLCNYFLHTNGLPYLVYLWISMQLPSHCCTTKAVSRKLISLWKFISSVMNSHCFSIYITDRIKCNYFGLLLFTLSYCIMFYPSFLRRWWGPGIGCSEKLWVSHPWRCSGPGWMRQPELVEGRPAHIRGLELNDLFNSRCSLILFHSKRDKIRQVTGVTLFVDPFYL